MSIHSAAMNDSSSSILSSSSLRSSSSSSSSSSASPEPLLPEPGSARLEESNMSLMISEVLDRTASVASSCCLELSQPSNFFREGNEQDGESSSSETLYEKVIRFIPF